MNEARSPRAWAFLLVLFAAALVACQKSERRAPSSSSSGAAASSTPAQPAESPETSRRIIRTAEISVETDAPGVATSKLSAIAAIRGGFIVDSDTTRRSDSEGAETVETTVVFRVPVGVFDDTLAAVRALGTRVSTEKVTGQDVTEEYVDLEARLRAQRAVEEQYMLVLKDAKTIPDILAVQQKLGEMRSDIERAEGRRRYLENQTSLSTITVHLAHHIEAVDASGPGFGRSARQAGHDAVTVALAIVNGAIRVAGFLLPVTVLLGAPLWLLIRWQRRRRRSGVPFIPT